MKNSLIIIFLVASTLCVGQKYKSESSLLSFYSYAPIEDIEATNDKTTAIIDAATGEIVISIPINKFEFDKSLMKEHFNEKYLESEKYPKAIFRGKIDGFDIDDLSLSKTATATGILKIHGVEKSYSLTGSIEKKDHGFEVNAEFLIKIRDHKIKVPKLLWENIAEEIEVKAFFKFVPYE